MIATGATRNIASAWKAGCVNVGTPIHGAAANAVKSMGLPHPRPFASSQYNRYPPMVPKMIGSLRQIPGADTATRAVISTVESPISASNPLPPLTDLTATGARLRPIAAITAPVTAGGINRSIQPTPDHMRISGILQYITPRATTQQ